MSTVISISLLHVLKYENDYMFIIPKIKNFTIMALSRDEREYGVCLLHVIYSEKVQQSGSI